MAKITWKDVREVADAPLTRKEIIVGVLLLVVLPAVMLLLGYRP